MNVTEITNQGLKREYKVTIPHQAIEGLLSERLQQMGEQTKIAGFRKGKIPLNVLQNRFGKEARIEVVQHVIREQASKILRENSLVPALEPEIRVINDQAENELEFVMSLETTPSIVLKDLQDMKFIRLQPTIAEDDIEKELRAIAERSPLYETVEKKRAAKKGDAVVIDFDGTVEERPLQGGSAKDFQLELGSGAFIPGFEDQLVGAKAGDKIKVSVTFPEDYQAQDIAGKKAEFDVIVKELKEKISAKIDDELAKRMGLADLAALKKNLEEFMLQDCQGRSRMHLKRQLLDLLAKQYDFAVPEKMVQVEFDAIWKQIEQELSQAQSREEVLGAEHAAADPETLRRDYQSIAERRVRLGFLLAEIGKKNSIVVTNDELRAAVVQQASRYPGQEKQVIEYYASNNQALMLLRAPLFEDKVVDHLLTQSEIADKKVALEEFSKELETLSMS